jgi:2,4-dienoyl-CoA reductase-like NADH-dependent reductase (Old Yellow Enzyme family)/NADPH-dependent 2,4-dienoyl-CoA reductase/sulfur reductase-like enzyme
VTAFKHIFQPIRIGSIPVKNRLLMSAMSINFGVDDKGIIDSQLIEYLVARAQGGVGMMLVGGGGVHPDGVELPNLPALWNDDCIPGLQKLVDAVKPYDCRLGMQLMHGGRQSYHENKVAPSAIPAPAVVKGVPKALTIEQIGMIVSAFGDAAARCKQAGFDFIEIHAAHGYLINQFMSPNANQRTDAYGGCFDNRIRFLLEIIADIKSKCGRDFPLGIRINGQDYIENGWTLPEALRLAPVLERLGADYLHVSAGVYGSKELTIPSMYAPQGCFVHLAQAVKDRVAIPVVAVGRIKKPEMADRILQDRQADVIALGRSLLADPQWPNKAEKGLTRNIRPCVGCCLGCIHAVLQLEPGGCVVNPDVGREYLLKHASPAGKPERVLIAGTGPAGLAAARMAASRGHRVTVCDRARDPGGALRLAAIPPGRSEMADIIIYFIDALKNLNVELKMDTVLDADLLRQIAPQTVVLATGSLPQMPLAKGLFQTRMQVCTVMEVLLKKVTVGDQVIVWGGNQIGLVFADYLAEQSKHVTVLHRKRHFAEEMSSNDRYYLRERLKKGRVVLYKEVRLEKFLDDGARLRAGGRPVTLSGFDSLIIAEPFSPLRQDANWLKKANVDIHFIGDARQPRHLMYAVSEGEELGREL